MDATIEDLLAWAKGERESALGQIELFGPGGVKAQLVMPDGSTQDITAGVITHQERNIPMFERLIATLSE